MLVQSILRRLHPLPRFVYGKVVWSDRRCRALHVQVRPRRGCKGICSGCGKRRPGYDVLDTRSFSFVPVWGIPVNLLYAMRRVDCLRCGVTVEMVPWATGKTMATHAFIWFLASWAKVLSWRETA